MPEIRPSSWLLLGAMALALLVTACGSGANSGSAPSTASAGQSQAVQSSSSSSSSSSKSSASSSSSSSSSSGSGAAGSVTLNWSAPTQNTDGSVLTDLSGYVVEFGQSAGSLDQTVAITDKTVTSHTFNNLPSGTWYFAIVTVDLAGTQSAPTNIVSATL